MQIDIPKVPSPKTFRQIPDANALLGDRDQLWRQFEEKGYLFFRGVLDLEAVAAVRKVYTDLLAKRGVITEGDQEYRFTGHAVTNIDYVGPLGDELFLGDAPWKSFVSHPSIKKFFFDLVGHDPAWVPIVEYKAVSPREPGPTRFTHVHQDSVYTTGFPFNICWIPLAEVGDDVGGLAIAEGMNDRHWHEPPALSIAPGLIPDDAWMRVEYQPGDLLIMHHSTPHSGITNISDRVRLSLDLRFVADTEHAVNTGEVVSVGTDYISVASDNGRPTKYAVDGETAYGPKSVTVQDIYSIGDEIIVASENDRATFIRFTSSARHAKASATSN